MQLIFRGGHSVKKRATGNLHCKTTLNTAQSQTEQTIWFNKKNISLARDCLCTVQYLWSVEPVYLWSCSVQLLISGRRTVEISSVQFSSVGLVEQVCLIQCLFSVQSDCHSAICQKQPVKRQNWVTVNNVISHLQMCTQNWVTVNNVISHTWNVQTKLRSCSE